MGKSRRMLEKLREELLKLRTVRGLPALTWDAPEDQLLDDVVRAFPPPSRIRSEQADSLAASLVTELRKFTAVPSGLPTLPQVITKVFEHMEWLRDSRQTAQRDLRDAQRGVQAKAPYGEMVGGMFESVDEALGAASALAREGCFVQVTPWPDDQWRVEVKVDCRQVFKRVVTGMYRPDPPEEPHGSVTVVGKVIREDQTWGNAVFQVPVRVLMEDDESWLCVRDYVVEHFLGGRGPYRDCFAFFVDKVVGANAAAGSVEPPECGEPEDVFEPLRSSVSFLS